MLITPTVETCIQHLGRVEEMAFIARRSYASAILGVVILSVCHMRAFWLIQRTYRWHFYTTRKGNPSSQMWFFVQLCSSWQDFKWLKGSHGLSAAAELLVNLCLTTEETNLIRTKLIPKLIPNLLIKTTDQKRLHCVCQKHSYQINSKYISKSANIIRSKNCILQNHVIFTSAIVEKCHILIKAYSS